MDLLPAGIGRNLYRCNTFEKPRMESLVSEGLQLAAPRYFTLNDREENLDDNNIRYLKRL